MQKIASSSASPKAMSVNIHNNLMSLSSHTHTPSLPIDYALLFCLKVFCGEGCSLPTQARPMDETPRAG